MNVIEELPWRANFLDALRLLGQAVTRLPFGIPDPVLGGAAAVELYTGSLWPAATLELLTVAAGPLIAELFAVGFRWGRPGHASGGVWHPKLQTGIEIAEHRAAMGSKKHRTCCLWRSIGGSKGKPTECRCRWRSSASRTLSLSRSPSR